MLVYPSATLAVHGGASALFIGAAVVSLGVLSLRGASPGIEVDGVTDRMLTIVGIGLVSPFAATLISELWHGKLVMNLLDSPSRFVAAWPVLLAMRRLPMRALKWSDLSFTIGAIVSVLVLLIAPKSTPDGRLASTFLDAIHFGDIALALGMLSALSLNWWRKDHVAIRVFKLVGLCAGLYASVLTGSRGGWLTIPVVVALVIYVRGKNKPGWWRWAIALAVTVAAVGVCISSVTVRERLFQVWSDLAQYAHGNRDTSTGVRLQLYKAALMLMRDHLVFGLGPNGFAGNMQALANAGELTPLAAQFGHGETHNQLLAYAANYGIIGGLAGIAVHLVPCVLFAKCLKAPSAAMRRAALMGLTFVVSFWVFGLSVETFDLKMVASFYAAVVAMFCAIATAPAAALVPRRDSHSSISGTQSQCSAS